MLKKFYHIPVVKKAIIDVVSIFKPPPYRRDLMEFEFDVWSGATTLHCINKRQLGENNTFPGFYRENTLTEYHKSSFDGSRTGLPMNMTALRGVMNQWEPSLALINAIRRFYMKRFNVADKTFGADDLFVLAKICAALPAFLVRRLDKPLSDGEISADIAAEFKITAGVFMVLRKIMENGIRWSDIEPISGEVLYGYADKHGVLISASGHACSGSKRKIIELIDFMIKGSPGGERMPESLAGLEHLVIDVDAFMDYSIQALTLEVLIVLFRSIAAKAFTSIDLNFLQIGEYKALGRDYAAIVNHVRRMFSEDVNLDCQSEVLCRLLEKLVGMDFCRELKRQTAESSHKISGELVKKMSHLPAGFGVLFAKAVGEYLALLGFLRSRGEDFQNRAFAALAWRKAARLSLFDVERRLDIVKRREIEKITGFNMRGWYEEVLKI